MSMLDSTEELPCVSEAAEASSCPSSESSSPCSSWTSTQSDSGSIIDHLRVSDDSGDLDVAVMRDSCLACVSTSRWAVAVSPEGIMFLGNPPSKEQVVYEIKFEEVERGDLLFINKGRLSSTFIQLHQQISDQEQRIAELETQLERALQNKDRNINRRQEKINHLEETVEQFTQMIGPLARRSLLDRVRNLILREYFTTTREDVARLVNDHINQGGDPYDPRISQVLNNHYHKACREFHCRGESSDAFHKKIHSIVSKTNPAVDLSCITMACSRARESFLRQAGNEAAHEFSSGDIWKYVFVERDGLKRKCKKRLMKLFRLAYPEPEVHEVQVDPSCDQDSD